MKLTPTQRAILEHRLSADTVPSVLASSTASEAADKVGEYGTPAWNATYDRVEAETLPGFENAAQVVKRMVNSLDLPLESLTPAEMAVVIDCLEGSTFFADEEDAIARGYTTASKARHAHTAAAYLAQAIELVTGNRVDQTAI